MANLIPSAFRAVEIALVAIKQNRVNTWAELMASGLPTRLEPEQYALVEQELATVQHIQVTAKKLVTLTYCPECYRTAFFGAGTMPSKCTLTFGCIGKPIKAGAARRVLATPDEDIAAFAAEVFEQ